MRRKLHRLIGAITAGVLSLGFLSAAVPTEHTPLLAEAASTCVVDLASANQTIRGFGGINHPEWVGDLTAAQRETAFGNDTANQLGFTILRVYVNDDRNQWYKALETAKTAQEKGALIFASPWNPPSDMTETFTRNGVANQKRLRHDKYAAYAQHLNDFVTYMRDNGVELYAISVQNEPDYAAEWTWWTTDEIMDFMKNYAGSIDCRIMSPESFQYRKDFYNEILNDSTALANMDILGTHFYGTQPADMAYPLFQQKGAGKELWMTEVYVPNSSSPGDTWPEALDVATNMHGALTNGFQAYVWWTIRRSYGPMKEDGTASKRGYMMAHYSKFVRPDYIRVDATASPATNVFITAYKGDDGKVVIVAINTNTSAVSQTFSMQNSGIATMDNWRTSANESMAQLSAISVTNNSFSATLPAQSVTTFVGSSASISTEPTTDADGYYFHSTYEDSANPTDDWAVRGATTIAASTDAAQTGSHSLLISGRTSAWHGTQHSISAYFAGKSVSLSACVMSPDATPAFYLSLQYTDAAGDAKYLHIDGQTTTAGSWVQLKNTDFAIPADARNIVVYLETAEGTDSFFADEVILAPAGTEIAGPAAIVETPYLLGDVNNDTRVNAWDLLLAKQGLLSGFADARAQAAADVDGSGAVTAADFSVYLDFLLGRVQAFPAQ